MNIGYPSNAENFILQLMNIAQMDIFNGQAITDFFLSFSNQNPFNAHFNDYGIGDMNYLDNTGSLIWPIFLGMLLLQIFSVMTN